MNTRTRDRRGLLRLTPFSFSTAALIGALGSVGFTAGCDGALSTGDPSDGGDGDSSGPVGTIGEDDIPTPSTRFRRLTHKEWQRTLVDLLALEDGPIADEIASTAERFRADPVQGGFIFDGNGDSLEVDSTLWSSYQGAAATIAYQVVSDPTLIDRLVPSAANDNERGAAFIESWGAKAHRRPLTSAQRDAYTAIFEAGKTAYTEHSGLLGGVRLVMEAFLQSPYFLYRVESSEDAAGGVIPLDGYERASRLSYFFWGTMPDDALFDAARAGTLDSIDGVRTQAQRLVADARARDTLIHFFEKVLEVEKYDTISPSSTAFPDVSGDLSDSARGETAHFLGSVLYDGYGSIRDLLTSTTTYVDDELADIYGLDGTFDDTFVQVELDPTQRAGVLTQVGFLATNSTSVDPDPIHRGVFVAKRFNCIKISAPPDTIPPLPSPNGQSNRQLVTEHTEAEGTSCRNCHTPLINPFGFAYEHYDAIGAYRTEDRSHPVDASAEVLVDDVPTPVDDAVQLASVLAESQGVHECLSGHLIAFAQGRATSNEDSALVQQLGSTSLQNAVSFRDLMVEMAVAVSFLNRSTEAE